MTMTMPSVAQLVLKCGASPRHRRTSASVAALAMMSILICTEASAQLPVPACKLPRQHRSTAWSFIQPREEHFRSNAVIDPSGGDRLVTKLGAADRLLADVPADPFLPSSLASADVSDIRNSASSITHQIVFAANQTRTASATTSSSINGSIYLRISDGATEGRSIAPETTARQ